MSKKPLGNNMIKHPNKVEVELLERLYSVKCSEIEQPKLHEAAEYLNKKLIEIRQHHKTLTREEIAMMAALNISYETLNGQFDNSGANQAITQLNKKIADFLTQD